MITTKPKVDPTGIYNLKETAKALEMSPSTIRRYCKEGIIKVRVRKSTGKRVITGADIIKCWREVYL